MSWEVEQKYPISDRAALEERLARLGARIGEAYAESDQYYAHPARDFAQTDEALRIRRVGEKNYITYKGPKVDAQTKTRREIELPLSEGAAGYAEFAQLLEALGFRPVAEVRKQRRDLTIPWPGGEVGGALDDVAEVGQFIELELLVGDEKVESAKSSLTSLAAALGLSTSERRGYLQLLLSQPMRKPLHGLQ